MLRAGLATVPGSRSMIRRCATPIRRLHHLDGDDLFTAFRTGRSKSREAFLATLHAGHSDYIINEEALA